MERKTVKISSAPAIFNLWCGGRDLNPRTPTGPDPESGAFGHAQPPPQLKVDIVSFNFTKKLYERDNQQGLGYVWPST